MIQKSITWYLVPGTLCHSGSHLPVDLGRFVGLLVGIGFVADMFLFECPFLRYSVIIV